MIKCGLKLLYWIRVKCRNELSEHPCECIFRHPCVSSILEISVCVVVSESEIFLAVLFNSWADNHLILYLRKHLFSNFVLCSKRVGSCVGTWSVSERTWDVGVQGAPHGVSCQLQHPSWRCRGCGGGRRLQGESCQECGCLCPPCGPEQQVGWKPFRPSWLGKHLWLVATVWFNTFNFQIVSF